MKKVLGLAAVIALAVGVLAPVSTEASANLIANNSFETASGNSAPNWTIGTWGTNTSTARIMTSGSQSGTRSGRVTISSYTNGDAKWRFKPVVVTSGKTYTFSNWYKSNAVTELDAEVIMQDGSTQYLWLATVPASSAWKQNALTFTAPVNAKKVSIIHILYSTGWLQTDNYSLIAQDAPSPTTTVTPPTTTVTPPTTTPPSPTVVPPTTTVQPPAPSTNLIPNASVDEGAANVINGWLAGYWGSLTAQFTTPTQGAQSGSRYARVDVINYTSGDAKWLTPAITVTAGKTYTFSSYYRANVSTAVDVEVTFNDGSVQYGWLGDTPAQSTWTKFTAHYQAPANVKSVRFFHVINKNGWLETDTYSLVDSTATTPPTPPPDPGHAPFSRPLVSIEFDDGWASAYQYGLPAVESFGWKPTQYIITNTVLNNDNYGGAYMTAAQVKDWNARGDIGSHSLDHSHIPTLSYDQIVAQLTQSKSYLDSLLGEPTSLYVSPYCESSAQVVSVARALYQSVRNCDSYTNYKASFDRWNLHSFIILSTTTDTEIVQALNNAKATNGWLILVWHEVAGDDPSKLYSVSQSKLLRQLQLVKDSGIHVTTTQAALNESLGQ
ncbi:polysaccharide deacetylase family protein [bacterium]|nr:polysaccharide deacetylase family protein [bacterium]